MRQAGRRRGAADARGPGRRARDRARARPGREAAGAGDETACGPRLRAAALEQRPHEVPPRRHPKAAGPTAGLAAVAAASAAGGTRQQGRGEGQQLSVGEPRREAAQRRGGVRRSVAVQLGAGGGGARQVERREGGWGRARPGRARVERVQ
jgi:hypothetical protein